MGLKSLPILNKCGVSMFWSNVWDSVKLHKKYNHSFLYLYNFIYYFLISDFYINYLNKYVISENDKLFKRINVDSLKLKKNYIGRINFFSYQNWTVISIYILSIKKKKVKLYNYIRIKNKTILNSIFYSKYNTNFYTSNYKYKFKNR